MKKTIGELASLCGGRLSLKDTITSDSIVHGVSTDSRKACRGQLFVPISGERYDGHDFAVQARANGAAASLWRELQPVPTELQDWTLILVDDPLAALQRLAAAYRRQLSVRVIGITGSNGKTTTKDVVAALLATVFRVHKTAGNFNNHIGLPLTILEMDEQTEVAVLEMGMSGFGEIELLSNIAQPDAVIITNIGDAHMLQLGSRAGIARAKLEIASGLKQGGLMIVNGDEPLLREGLHYAKLPESVRLLSFGAGPDNNWRAEQMRIEASGSSFSVSCSADQSAGKFYWSELELPVPGKHNILNATAAIAVAHELGVQEQQIRHALSELRISAMRIETVRASNDAAIINDAYNANPTAVRAAIDLVHQLQGYRKKWLVLGDMLELGPDEIGMHQEIGRYVSPMKADALLTCGKLSEYTSEAALQAFNGRPDAIRHFGDKLELANYLKSELRPEDLVLVKGSRGMRMEEIVEQLVQR